MTRRSERSSVLCGLPLLMALAALPAAGQSLGGCPIFPSDNVWNVPIDDLPVHPMSATWIATMGAGTALHADFGSDLPGPFGIPYDIVPQSQAKMNVVFDYPDLANSAWDESDGYDQCGGPPPTPQTACYPILPNATIEGGPGADPGSDRHVLMVQQTACKLWEIYATQQVGGYPATSWRGFSGAIFDLRSNALRTDGWTSADAAGLPILPGLVRVEEADQGYIHHAFRFTTLPTFNGYVWPARHEASSNNDVAVPPMGIRVRLRGSFPIQGQGYSPRVQAILRAMKKYGMLLADNGGDWYVSGAPSLSWDDGEMHDAFDPIHGSDFEVVDESSLQVSADSGQTPRMFRDGFEFGSGEGWDLRVGGF